MPSHTDVRHTLCFFCWVNCGVKVHIDPATQQPIRVEGDPDYFYSKGYICDRARIALEHHFHPDRLNYPLKRIGRRGEGRWQRIPWGQALDEIAAKLKEVRDMYGPWAIGSTQGTGRGHHEFAQRRFMHLLGSLNTAIHSGQVCYMNVIAIESAILGGTNAPLQFLERLGKLVVLLGRNSAECVPVEMKGFEYLKEKGCRFIVVDPRFTDTVGKLADLWLRIRPGTDSALMLSWINILIRENLYDQQFVLNWTNAPFLVRMDTKKLLRGSELTQDLSKDDFVVQNRRTAKPALWVSKKRAYRQEDVEPMLHGSFEVKLKNGNTIRCRTVWDLLEEAVAEYTPENTSRITWVPAEKINESARMIGLLKPANWPWGVANDQTGYNATQQVWCKSILRMLTGNINIFGGEYIMGAHPLVITDGDAVCYEHVPSESKNRQLGSHRYRLMGWQGSELIEKYSRQYWGRRPNHVYLNIAHVPTFWNAVLTGKPYPIKAIISSANNLLTSAPNTMLVYEALKRVSLFVVIDHWMAPHVMLADYALPATAWIERSIMNTRGRNGFTNVISCSRKAIEPLHERKDDYWIYRELGIRFGQGQYWPNKTLEEEHAWRLSPLLREKAMTFEEFTKNRIGVDMTNWKEKYHELKDSKTGVARGFGTQSGRCEIWPSIFDEIDMTALPHFREPPYSPISRKLLAKKYPLILITGTRVFPFFHSEHRQISSIRRKVPHPFFEIHPDSAREYNIGDGEYAIVESPFGKVKMKAKTTATIHPRVVNVPHGWWYPEEKGEEPTLYKVLEIGANMLTPSDPDICDPYCGSWPLKALLCQVKPLD